MHSAERRAAGWLIDVDRWMDGSIYEKPTQGERKKWGKEYILGTLRIGYQQKERGTVTYLCVCFFLFLPCLSVYNYFLFLIYMLIIPGD